MQNQSSKYVGAAAPTAPMLTRSLSIEICLKTRVLIGICFFESKDSFLPFWKELENILFLTRGLLRRRWMGYFHHSNTTQMSNNLFLFNLKQVQISLASKKSGLSPPKMHNLIFKVFRVSLFTTWKNPLKSPSFLAKTLKKGDSEHMGFRLKLWSRHLCRHYHVLCVIGITLFAQI